MLLYTGTMVYEPGGASDATESLPLLIEMKVYTVI
jgi:hypothetical protein